MDRARDGEPLPRHVAARGAQSGRLQQAPHRGGGQGRDPVPQGADRVRRGHRRADLRGSGPAHQTAALYRRDHRRDGRSHAGRRQGSRGRPATAGADGAGRRHSPHHRHPATLGRCHHRHHQGQFPDPHQLPGNLEDRQPDDSRRAGRRAASRPGRHAVHVGGRPYPAGSRPLRIGCRSRAGGPVPQEPIEPRLYQADHRRRRSDADPRGHQRRGWRRRRGSLI